MFCSVPQRAVADLDLQMREGGGHPDPKGGGPVSKNFFTTFWASVWSKYKGGPWASSLDPPLEREGEAEEGQGISFKVFYWSVARYLKKQDVKVIQCNQVYFECL